MGQWDRQGLQVAELVKSGQLQASVNRQTLPGEPVDNSRVRQGYFGQFYLVEVGFTNGDLGFQAVPGAVVGPEFFI